MLFDFANSTLVVNFKAYLSAVGENAASMAKIIEKEAMASAKRVILCVQAADIDRVSQAVGLPVFAQHIDAESGAKTGSINPKSVREAGASGVMINHAEKRVKNIGKHIETAKSENLSTLVCVQSLQELETAARHLPTAIAIEVPELIGTGKSISSEKPELVSEAVKLGEKYKIPVLCGAGISTSEDVKESFSLGAKGILVASAIVMSEHPGKIAKEIIGAMK